MDWYPWVKLAHVVGAFGFVFAHGVSAFAAFRMRSDRRPENVRSMMELSSTSFGIMYGSLLLLLVAGVVAGFIGDWWGTLWIWAAIVLLLGIATAMYLVGTRYYIEVRHAVGQPVPQDAKDAPPPAAVSDEALASLLDSPRPHILATIGGIGLLLIIGLMVMKPG